MRIAVTGAYGFSGQYIAQRLLGCWARGHYADEFARSKKPIRKTCPSFPLQFFYRPAELEESLRDVDILINKYWVRFDNPPQFTFAKAIANSKVLFDAAKRAGVRRVVHISITNPERESDLPYFSGKAEVEAHLQSTGMSYSILRPALLFGEEDILINDIAWSLRYLPVFGLYGDGQYRLQPIYVDDLAAAVVQRTARILTRRRTRSDRRPFGTVSGRNDRPNDRLVGADCSHAADGRLPERAGPRLFRGRCVITTEEREG